MTTATTESSIDSALDTLMNSNLEELNRTQSKELCFIIDSLSDDFKVFLTERVRWPQSWTFPPLSGGVIRGLLHHQTPMSSSTINRVELTDAQRREFQALLERNCSSIFDDLGDAVSDTCQEYAEALNSTGDDETTESFREELFSMIDYRCVVAGLNDWYLLPCLNGGGFFVCVLYLRILQPTTHDREYFLRNRTHK